MNEIESIFSDWEAKELFGFNKSITPKYFNEDKLIYHIRLTSVTVYTNEVPKIVLSRYFVLLGSDKDSDRLIDFLQSISNEIYLATIGII